MFRGYSWLVFALRWWSALPHHHCSFRCHRLRPVSVRPAVAESLALLWVRRGDSPGHQGPPARHLWGLRERAGSRSVRLAWEASPRRMWTQGQPGPQPVRGDLGIAEYEADIPHPMRADVLFTVGSGCMPWSVVLRPWW
ncbi:hypothetical protein EDB89DRAFT_1971594, partial [Lactarius sanguifluus]